VRQILYLLIICGISTLFWTLDHRPEFYMGDSASYMRTAVQEYIPPDRSFVYGFIIRWIGLPFHSLKPLMIAQGLAGILSCAGLAICLKRYDTVNVGNDTCFLMALLFCVEPMHMMFQRYVLTEALTMPIFIGYLMASLSYLKKRRLIKLAILQVLGIALISMRLIFLPLVLINTVILPLLMPPRGFRQALAHLLTNLFLILVFHGSYCMLNGKLSNAPPGYTYYDGFFALSAWAPAVTVSSAANPQVAEIIRRGSEYDLNKFPRRYYQLWDAKGIVFRIKSIAPDLVTANRWAKITARRAFAQNPVAVLTVALKTYIEFNTYEKIQNELRIDRGDDRPMSKTLVKWLKENFSADTHEFIEQHGEYWQLPSVTKLIQNHAAPWMLLLVQTPSLCLVAGALNKGCRLFCFYLSGASLIYIATVCFLTPLVITRLLYPLTVPFFLSAGWMIAFTMPCDIIGKLYAWIRDW
jgi:hypothetical protein